LQDLGGPKIRTGNFSTNTVELVAGQTFTFTTDDIEGDVNHVSINYPLLPKEIEVGHIIFLDDGRKKLKVTAVNDKEVVCIVEIGGEIKGRRGVNLPNSDLSVKSLTEKDIADLEFGIENKVDFVALSFVRRPSDITELRDILNSRGSDAGIIAKIETPQAVANIDEIIRLADGIMVARGDLAIEIPFEQVPMVQKSLIQKCNESGKPIITATQMLESMIKSPVATRAEVSDVANAILDGTDAIMLSEETTLGQFPVEAVSVMAKVADEIEKNYPEKDVFHAAGVGETTITDSITGSVVKTAHDVGAKAIVALSESGFTARMVSRHKPQPIILALSPNARTSQKLALSFGCMPITIPRYESVADVFDIVRTYCAKHGIGNEGESVVIAAGAPFNTKGVATNMLIVETL